MFTADEREAADRLIAPPPPNLTRAGLGRVDGVYSDPKLEELDRLLVPPKS